LYNSLKPINIYTSERLPSQIYGRARRSKSWRCCLLEEVRLALPAPLVWVFWDLLVFRCSSSCCQPWEFCYGRLSPRPGPWRRCQVLGTAREPAVVVPWAQMAGARAHGRCLLRGWSEGSLQCGWELGVLRLRAPVLASSAWAGGSVWRCAERGGALLASHAGMRPVHKLGYRCRGRGAVCGAAAVCRRALSNVNPPGDAAGGFGESSQPFVPPPAWPPGCPALGAGGSLVLLSCANPGRVGLGFEQQFLNWFKEVLRFSIEKKQEWMFLVARPSCYGGNLPIFQLLHVGIPSFQRAKAEEGWGKRTGSVWEFW